MFFLNNYNQQTQINRINYSLEIKYKAQNKKEYHFKII